MIALDVPQVTMIKAQEGVVLLEVDRNSDGTIRAAVITVYREDGARTAQLTREGAEQAERALCPPMPLQGPGSEGSA